MVQDSVILHRALIDRRRSLWFHLGRQAAEMIPGNSYESFYYGGHWLFLWKPWKEKKAGGNNFRSCRIAQPSWFDRVVGYGRLFASVYGDFVVDFMVFTKWWCSRGLGVACKLPCWELHLHYGCLGRTLPGKMSSKVNQEMYQFWEICLEILITIHGAALKSFYNSAVHSHAVGVSLHG